MDAVFSPEISLGSILIEYLSVKDIASVRAVSVTNMYETQKAKGNWHNYVASHHTIKVCGVCQAICLAKQVEYCSLCEDWVCVTHLEVCHNCDGIFCSSCQGSCHQMNWNSRRGFRY